MNREDKVLWVAPVSRREDLPKPEQGMVAYDLTRSDPGLGIVYLWVVENDEWGWESILCATPSTI